MRLTQLQLGDSTNRWGTPPAAGSVIAECADGVNDYPSAFGDALKVAAAGYIGVAPEEIVTGCGSDNVLDTAIRAYSAPGDGVAWCSPTFVMMPLLAQLQGLKVHEIAFTSSGDADADALLATGARIIYVCTPNNPTGSLAARETLEHLAREASGLLIIDEAYAEFSGTSVAALAPQRDRVLVTRTMSKAFGLAGLRAGYGIAHAGVIRKLERARGPYTLNSIAERAAVAALATDQEWMRERVVEAVVNRERLAESLRAMGFVPLSSAANFLCVPMPDAVAVARALAHEGIIVRAFSGLRGIGDAIRISSAPWPQLERFLSAFAQLHASGRS